MALLLICLYWFIISLQVIGGAVLFRRLFPRESPWFGFVLPPLALILVLNFAEHCIAMPSLLWILPFTALGSVYLLFAPETQWKGLKLPTGIFLGAFAFTLALRALKPNIFDVSSGVYDLPLIASFCMGQKLPPSFSWFPNHDIGQYYTFVHYSASVLTRLLNVNVGTGFNLSSALLSAWICFATAAIAWTVSRHSVWITIVAAVLVECAANGTNAYLWLTVPNLDPVVTSDIFIGLDHDDYKTQFFFKMLKPFGYIYDRRELEIPGFWSWLGTYHATCGGQFFTLFSVWSLVELLRRRPTNWPWIGLIATPVLMLITSTWGTPMVGVLTILGLCACLYYRLKPQNLRQVMIGLCAIAVLLAPTLIDFLPTAIVYYKEPIRPDTHTQLFEFLVYWWPIFIPWFGLLFIWRKLSPAVKIVYVLVPIAFAAVESYTIGVRIDMTGKLWGYIWGAGWSVLFPVVAMRRGFGFRFVTALLLISSFITLCSWIDWYKNTIAWDNDVLALEGSGPFHSDPVKAKILGVISEMKGQVLLTGMPAWCCPDCPMGASLTRNYSYIDADFYVANTFCPSTFDTSTKRNDEVEAFYNGKVADPLTFLRYRNIAAVIIWPDDNTKDDLVASLKQKLAPYYEYRDFKVDTAPNAGVFVYHSGLEEMPRLEPLASAQPTPAPVLAVTPAPVATPAPSATPAPAVTPNPVAIPTPAVTSVPVATPTPAATTPVPAVTPAPAATPAETKS